MAKKKSTLARRVKVAEAAKEKYHGKSFSFKLNRDCARMTNFVCKKLGCAPFMHSQIGTYTTALGAKRALKKLGYDNLIEMMDDKFPRIAPANALPCDIIAMPSEDESIGSLAVSLGNGIVLAYYTEDAGAVIGSLEESIAAWRVLPL